MESREKYFFITVAILVLTFLVYSFLNGKPSLTVMMVTPTPSEREMVAAPYETVKAELNQLGQ